MMAQLVYSAISSLDGYIEDTGGKFDWAMPFVQGWLTSAIYSLRLSWLEAAKNLSPITYTWNWSLWTSVALPVGLFFCVIEQSLSPGLANNA